MSASYKLALIAAIVAVVEARFGQEQIPVAAVSALDGQFGNSGQAATLAGGVPGSLLGGADPCEKLRLADEIVTTLGNDPAVIAAAAGLVSAEQNFNPFATTIPNICGDASLPATEALRGITPLVDPAVADAATANQLSAQSLTTPFDATGLSVAQVMIAQGFANIAVDGTPNAGANTGGDAGAGAGADAGNNAGNNNNNNAGNGADAGNNAGNGADAGNNNNAGGNADAGNNAGGNAGNANDCDGGNANDDAANDNAGNGNAGNGDAGNNQNNNNNGGDAGNAGGNAGGDAGNAGGNAGAGGADFGLCDPRMDFQFGRGNRAATEGSFLPVDPQIGGADALNPNIITQRTCDQLTNVCEANDAAKALCQTARAEVEAAGSRGPEIADLFNSALGL